MSVSEETLAQLCPLYLAVGPRGTIRRAGPTARKILGPVVGRPLFEVIAVSRPAGITTLEDLRARAGRKLHLTAKSAPTTPLVAHAVAEADGGMFLDLGFGIGVAEAVARHGLTATDFPATDLTVEVLYLVEAQRAAMQASRTLNLRLHSARVAAEADAATDALTGLGNRRAVDLTLAALAREEAAFGLVHLDLDHFKAVNDRLGHAAGDQVLCDVADALSAAIRPDDIAARIGGDEFLLIFPHLSDAKPLHDLCLRLIERIERPRLIDGTDCRISASAGVAIWPGGAGVDRAEMIDRADQALYESKRAGRGRVSLADPLPPAQIRKAALRSGFLPSGS